LLDIENGANRWLDFSAANGRSPLAEKQTSGPPSGDSFDEIMRNFELQRCKEFSSHVCVDHPRNISGEIAHANYGWEVNTKAADSAFRQQRPIAASSAYRLKPCPPM
jgi:hypothetical protein